MSQKVLLISPHNLYFLYCSCLCLTVPLLLLSLLDCSCLYFLFLTVPLLPLSFLDCSLTVTCFTWLFLYFSFPFFSWLFLYDSFLYHLFLYCSCLYLTIPSLFLSLILINFFSTVAFLSWLFLYCSCLYLSVPLRFFSLLDCSFEGPFPTWLCLHSSLNVRTSEVSQLNFLWSSFFLKHRQLRACILKIRQECCWSPIAVKQHNMNKSKPLTWKLWVGIDACITSIVHTG